MSKVIINCITGNTCILLVAMGFLTIILGRTINKATTQIIEEIQKHFKKEENVNP